MAHQRKNVTFWWRFFSGANVFAGSNPVWFAIARQDPNHASRRLVYPHLLATVCAAADVRIMLSELHSKRIQERILS